MDKKRTNIAKRLTGRLLLWVAIVTLGLAYLLFHFEGNSVRDFYAEIYRNKMLTTNEYMRRVISDVYVAVTNNIYYLEHSLDNPDGHKLTMERIVKSGTRVRSCGISFIKDYYYPQKESHFCPFAWRNVANPDIVYSQDMGDADLDYFDADWFLDVIKSDSAYWSEPFYDGYDEKTSLSAYMVPIHDQEGRVVAALGADISLDWLANKLIEADSTFNKESMLMASLFNMKSHSFLINHDGTFLTHTDEGTIMKGNFYSQLASCDGNDIEAIIGNIRAGKEPEGKSAPRCMVNGEECFLFYTPVKYTKWMMVSVVPCHAIDVLGYINAGTTLLIFLLAILLIVTVAHYSIKGATAPIRQLTRVTDDIAKGQFSTPVPEMKHNDELSQLRDSIHEMQFTLSNYADNTRN